ncbi:MAG: signal peptidase II [Azoarcus sp.]|jgi:signal peptidase II|nr:signal peptidase II [Azoarcus sp.]
MPDRRAGFFAAMAPWLTIIVIVAALDQATKEMALKSFLPGERLTLTPFFDLVLAFNPGAAFSFLAEHSGWQRWFFTGLATLVCAWLLVMIWQHRETRLLPLAFSFVVGGALGNVIDRVRLGHVVDFLSFHAGEHYWPAFNLADSAITLGVILMLASQFGGKPKTAPPEPPA